MTCRPGSYSSVCLSLRLPHTGLKGSKCLQIKLFILYGSRRQCHQKVSHQVTGYGHSKMLMVTILWPWSCSPSTGQSPNTGETGEPIPGLSLVPEEAARAGERACLAPLRPRGAPSVHRGPEASPSRFHPPKCLSPP